MTAVPVSPDPEISSAPALSTTAGGDAPTSGEPAQTTEPPGEPSSPWTQTASEWPTDASSSVWPTSSAEWTSSGAWTSTAGSSAATSAWESPTPFPTITTDEWTSTTAWISTSATLSPTPTPLPATEEALYDAWALLILFTLLLASLLSAYALRRFKIRYIHETVLAVILGLAVGLVIRLAGGDQNLQRLVKFDPRYFFNLLLPPILLNSGYEMQMNMFFRNLGTILVFAFLGTIFSALIVAVFIYFFVLTGLHRLALSFLDCFVLGAILSSTDPVTVLAVFRELRVEPRLYSIIFGESILNDSVAIVLFSTLGLFRSSALSFLTLLQGTGLFVLIFVGSVLIGLVFGLLSALLFKHSLIYRYPPLESCVLTLLAYCSYLLANAMQLSGIVSLLFCGIAMRHYAYPNLAEEGRRTTKYMFKVLSTMSEVFIFVSLGITVFAGTDPYYPGLIVYTLAVLLLARYLSVLPLAQIINSLSRPPPPPDGELSLPASPRAPFTPTSRGWLSFLAASPTSPTRLARGEDEPIPRGWQHILVLSGLRGAIAFALAYQLDAPNEDTEKATRSTTLLVCVASVLLLGSLVVPAVGYFGIRTGVAEPEREGSDSESEHGEAGDGEEERLMGAAGQGRQTHWFVSFDQRILQPFFRVRRRRTGAHEQDADDADADGEPETPVQTPASASRRAFGRSRVTVTPAGASAAAPPPARGPAPSEEFVDAAGRAWARQERRDDPLFPLPPPTRSSTGSQRLVGGIIDLGTTSGGPPRKAETPEPGSGGPGTPDEGGWSAGEGEGFGLFSGGNNGRGRGFGGLDDL
ncbi:Sodium/hydrogen exchanger family-domain-containing protein [Hyaloraphidium curvatum]|nr:Sodium/hydrogen exchanger family-domain-containing protein [Hyaloraphidium curvatum]